LKDGGDRSFIGWLTRSGVADQEVGGIFGNDHVVIKDDDSPLLDDAEPALSHLVGKGVLLNLLNNP
jgi:hypothetical protein